MTEVVIGDGIDVKPNVPVLDLYREPTNEENTQSPVENELRLLHNSRAECTEAHCEQRERHACCVCGVSFVGLRSLKYHELKWHPQKVLCFVCCIEMPKSQLAVHIRTEHSTCHICEKHLANYSIEFIKNHFEVHSNATGVKPEIAESEGGGGMYQVAIEVQFGNGTDCDTDYKAQGLEMLKPEVENWLDDDDPEMDETLMNIKRRLQREAATPKCTIKPRKVSARTCKTKGFKIDRFKIPTVQPREKRVKSGFLLDTTGKPTVKRIPGCHFHCLEPNCGKGFKVRQQLQCHIHQHHDYITAACDICGVVCKNMYKLKKHMHEHYRPYVPCPYCAQMVKKSCMYDHVGRKHTHTIPVRTKESAVAKRMAGKTCCNYCFYKEFENEQALQEHMKEKHNMPCPYCKLCYGKKWDLDQHMFTVHKIVSADRTGHMCHYCALLCFDKRTLTRHIANVHINLRVQCDLCEYRPKLYEVWRHLKAVHLKIGRPWTHLEWRVKVTCPHCPATIAKYNLVKHVRRMHTHRHMELENGRRRSRNYRKLNCICSVCGEMLRRHNMKRHMYTMHGISPPGPLFTCDVCGEKGMDQALLHEHMYKVHITNRPCPVCGKNLTRQGMVYHMKTKHSVDSAKVEKNENADYED